GDYQITVATQGQSTGHLGLTLERTQLADGGALSEGGPARRALAAGEAVAYRFTIAEAGDYRVRSFGAGTTFRCRLEDDAGWPLEPPNVTADLTRHFEPGTYRIVSLPEPVATRRVTLFERVRQATKREGHGPHALGLAERVEHVWTEPEAGQARVRRGGAPGGRERRRRRRRELPDPGRSRRRGISPARRARRTDGGDDDRVDARARGGGGATARAAREGGGRARGQRAGLPAPGAARRGAATGRGERAGERRLRARGGRAHGGGRGGADGARRGAA